MQPDLAAACSSKLVVVLPLLKGLRDKGSWLEDGVHGLQEMQNEP